MHTVQYIHALRTVLVAPAAAFLVVACGGGGEAQGLAAPAARSAPQQPQAAELPLRAPQVPDATALMDWAESQFPQYFPGHQANIVSSPYIYRAYPTTGNYLGLSGVDIYILGPTLSGGELKRVGSTADFACNVYPASCVVVAPAGPSSQRGSTLWNTALGSLDYACADCHFNPRQNFSNIWNASGTAASSGNPTAITQAIAANQGGLMFQFDTVSATDLADIAAYVNASRFSKALQ